MAITASWQDIPTSAVSNRFPLRLQFEGVTQQVSGLMGDKIVLSFSGFRTRGLNSSEVTFIHEGNNIWLCVFDFSSIINSETSIQMRLRPNAVRAEGMRGPSQPLFTSHIMVDPSISTVPTVTFTPAIQSETVRVTYNFPTPVSGLTLSDWTDQVEGGTATALIKNSNTEYVLLVRVDQFATTLIVTLPANSVNEGNAIIETNIPVEARYLPTPTRISNILPPTSSELERDLVNVFSEVFLEMFTVEHEGKREIPIRHLWNPDLCPTHLLPYLACAMSVDGEATDFSEDQLRSLIKTSLSIHRKKGTIASIKELIEALGYSLDRIDEGSDGHWAKFRVVMATPLSIANAKLLKMLIEVTAPLSRELSSFESSTVHQYDGTITSDGSYTHGVINI